MNSTDKNRKISKKQQNEKISKKRSEGLEDYQRVP